MILQSDVLEQLATLADESVQCVVTSIPYWGLRDYGLPPQVWDDLGGCEHEWVESVEPGGQGTGESFRRDRKAGRKRGGHQPGFCSKCNAWRGSLGLEPTPELYLQHAVGVFREIRRVLRKDGTLWLNMGDSYAVGKPRLNEDCADGGMRWSNRQSFRRDRRPREDNPHKGAPGLKPKDLCGIPWRLALALQADGWWLRSDIIWAKPSPMPESCTDRPTRSHEYIFLLTRSARYFYDAEAVREPGITGDMRRPYGSEGMWAMDGRPEEQRHGGDLRKSKAPDGWDTGDGSHGTIHRDGREKGAPSEIQSGRNLRSVWNIPTQPYPDAHFATFPEKLVARCILAGTSEKGACPECGAPWARLIKQSDRYMKILGEGYHDHSADLEKGMKSVRGINRQNKMRDAGISGKELVTTGWRQTCECGREDVRPCVVLDPFIGSGTVGKVAQDLGRDWIGIELNPDYCEMARKRTMHRQERLDLA